MNWLYLSQTAVADLSPVTNLSNLERLFLGGTQVNDLKPLVGLSSLEELYIEGAPVTDEEVHDLQKALPNCKITR